MEAPLERGQPAGSGENALRYLARYVFKTATSNRRVWLLPDGKVLWNYRDSQTGQNHSLKLEPMEFMRRFLQHILPRGYARVRTFGWLHPAAKVRANRVRALLRQKPRLTPAEQQAWHPTEEPDLELPESPPPVESTTPRCRVCQREMLLVGSWHKGEPMLLPKRPP